MKRNQGNGKIILLNSVFCKASGGFSFKRENKMSKKRKSVLNSQKSCYLPTAEIRVGAEPYLRNVNKNVKMFATTVNHSLLGYQANFPPLNLAVFNPHTNCHVLLKRLLLKLIFVFKFFQLGSEGS